MNYFTALLKNKCPRCRQGDMFCNHSFYKKGFMKMPENCPECGQPMEIEVGFYYGTGYVSYALTVAFSVASFIAWWVIIGISFDDNRFFWWIGTNAIALILLMPWFMKLSRAIWLSFFAKYNPNWKNEKHISSERSVRMVQEKIEMVV